MPQILAATNDTPLKRRIADSSHLDSQEKFWLKKGDRLEITQWSQASDRHLMITLHKPIYGTFNWYIFENHCQVIVDGAIVFPSSDTILKVPCYLQTDNRVQPARTCNSSACAAAARYLGAKISGDDEYWAIVNRFGDTTSQEVQTSALKTLGIKSQWRTDLDFADLDESLQAGLPIVIGILHRGSLEKPSGGHMLTVIGKTRKDYVVNDPYGSLLDAGGAYTGKPENGCGAIYPRAVLEKRWTVDGDRSGWGRLFYGNKK